MKDASDEEFSVTLIEDAARAIDTEEFEKIKEKIRGFGRIIRSDTLQSTEKR